jgi:hypothetical protein
MAPIRRPNVQLRVPTVRGVLMFTKVFLWRIEVEFKSKVKSKIKGDGQVCPSHPVRASRCGGEVRC